MSLMLSRLGRDGRLLASPGKYMRTNEYLELRQSPFANLVGEVSLQPALTSRPIAARGLIRSRPGPGSPRGRDASWPSSPRPSRCVAFINHHGERAQPLGRDAVSVPVASPVDRSGRGPTDNYEEAFKLGVTSLVQAPFPVPGPWICACSPAGSTNVQHGRVQHRQPQRDTRPPCHHQQTPPWVSNGPTPCPSHRVGSGR